jgi:hypothetical protein
MGEIPQETISAIASYLDNHSLRNLSLISRAFVAESQRQLFRRVELCKHRHFQRWYRKITPAHPIIPFYVRTLTVDFAVGFYYTPTRNGSDYDIAPEIFTSFTKLEEIFLCGLTLCHPQYLSMLTNFSASAPSIRSLRIETIQCSPSLMTKFIYLFPHLDNLRIEKAVVTEDKPYDLPTPSPSFQGHGRFTITRSDYCPHLLHLPLRFKCLYLAFYLLNLAQDLDEQNASILNDFFVTCAPTLEHLTLRGESLSSSPITGSSGIGLGSLSSQWMENRVTQVLDLSPCRRLRTLRLDLGGLYECPLYATQTLASLKSSPRLETITLAFYSLREQLIDSLRRFGDEWDAVDTQLCQLAELRDGNLHVSVEFSGFEIEQGIPLSAGFGTFMAKFRCSPHSFSALSKLTTDQDTG